MLAPRAQRADLEPVALKVESSKHQQIPEEVSRESVLSKMSKK